MNEDDTQRFSDAVGLSSASDASFAQLDSAEDFETIATELEAAAAHCHRAAQQMAKGLVPRGCAHGFAAQGHLHKALRTLEELTIRHADHATLEEE